MIRSNFRPGEQDQRPRLRREGAGTESQQQQQTGATEHQRGRNPVAERRIGGGMFMM